MVPSEVMTEQPVKETPKNNLINDFSLQVATANGSGSQTANLVLLRSISGWVCQYQGKTCSLRI